MDVDESGIVSSQWIKLKFVIGRWPNVLNYPRVVYKKYTSMGAAPTFPVQRVPITFESAKTYTSSGKKDWSRCTRVNITEFEKSTQKHFENVIEKRRCAKEAREKLDDLTPFLDKYEQWTARDIEDLRTQFMSFDINGDGLIDFPELDRALNELGDKSTSGARRAYFDAIDVDHSDSIDFEEFLEYIHSQLLSKVTTEGLSQAIGSVCSYGQKCARALRCMTFSEQMEAGLF